MRKISAHYAYPTWFLVQIYACLERNLRLFETYVEKQCLVTKPNQWIHWTFISRTGDSIIKSPDIHVDEAQKQVALATIADVNASGLWPDKVVTELEPAGDFWEAEPEHQDYIQRFPNGYTCHYLRPKWALPQRET